MLPIGPLMIEHRLIERMIRLMHQEAGRIRENIAVSRDFAFVNLQFIDTAADFVRTYADRLHHGKEEDILFAALQEKPLTPEHRQILEALQEEHVLGRKITANLLAAKEQYVTLEQESLDELLENMMALVEFFPRHIDKEDRHFFLPVMEYFSREEKDTLLERMNRFDQDAIQEKYQNIVAAWAAGGCKCHL